MGQLKPAAAFVRPVDSLARRRCIDMVSSIAPPPVGNQSQPDAPHIRAENPGRRHCPPKNPPAPVLLSQSQLQAVTQIQAAAASLGQMIGTINHLSALHRLPVREIIGADIGLIMHELEGIVFDHNCAAARGRNAGRRAAA